MGRSLMRFVLGALVLGAAPGLVVLGGPAAGAGVPGGRHAATAGAGHRLRPATSLAISVTPSSGLVDGQTVTVIGTGAEPGSTFIAVDCGPEAYSLLEDGCDNQRNTVLYDDADGIMAGRLQVEALLNTAAGVVDCRVETCFVALFALYQPSGGVVLATEDLGFAADACAAPGSCQVPPISTGPVPAGRPRHRAGRPRAGRRPATTVTVPPGSPAQLPHEAGLAGDLTQPGAVTGPYTGPLGGSAPPPTPVTGEGLVRLALSAPGTAWGPGTPSALVVDVSVDGGTTQQIVLFDGSSSFVYAGFTGPTTTGSHTVTVALDTAYSAPAAGVSPVVDVVDAELEVVGPTNPSYLEYAYAPVMYGRSSSALHDTPLVESCTVTPESGGATQLSYTEIWSHENGGTGFVPWLESGSWGRLTDIETSLTFTVDSDGSVTDATYLWGGEPLTGSSDQLSATQEVDVPFAGSFWGHHPVYRDATGNNDFSDEGTTGFRFQQALVDPPAAGQTREAVMDANPWTYRIMGVEAARWYTDVTTDWRSPQVGDARQYAYVDIDTSASGSTPVTAVGVDLQLAGSSTWYENDLGSGYPLIGAGHSRTVVKMPLGWQGRSITGVRLRVFPASAASELQVVSFTVRQLSQSWALSVLATPAAQIVGGVVSEPPAITATPVAGDGQTVEPGGQFAPMVVSVTDMAGEPLAGILVTFRASPESAAVGTVGFAGCAGGDVTLVTPADGTVSTGPSWAGLQAYLPGDDSFTTPDDVAVGVPDPFGATTFDQRVIGYQFEAGHPERLLAPDAGAYVLASADGGVFACGGDVYQGSPSASGHQPSSGPGRTVGISSTSYGAGYLLAQASGSTESYGPMPAPTTGGQAPATPITSMASNEGCLPIGGEPWCGAAMTTADGVVYSNSSLATGSLAADGVRVHDIVGIGVAGDFVDSKGEGAYGGYWLAGADGGVFAIGAPTPFDGSLPSLHIKPAAPIVGIVSEGCGYLLVGADGGVYAFGCARFFGSLPGLHIKPAAPIVGMAVTPDQRGYWLVGADGGVFAFGDAPFAGSLAGRHLAAPVVGIAGPWA